MKEGIDRTIDKTKKETGSGHQIFNMDSPGALRVSARIPYKTLKEHFKEFAAVIGEIVFWILFVWGFLKSFYAGY
jgi:hypothetical protein